MPAPERLGYDTLIVAGGSHYSYFGHEEWRMHAAEVKSLESALAVRSRLLAAFEAAEGEPNAEARDAWLTFVVVGAGPTGVEMAGQIAELARDTLRRDFRTIDPRHARILLSSKPPIVSVTAPNGIGYAALAAAYAPTAATWDAFVREVLEPVRRYLRVGHASPDLKAP